MILNKKIIEEINNQLLNLEFGSVQLRVFRRGKNHTHYEITKTYTLMDDDEVKNNMEKSVVDIDRNKLEVTRE